MSIDLTGGEVKVLGNLGDEHIFRLSNPEGQDIINSGGTYEGEFISKQSAKSSITLDISEVVDGVLIIPITIANGWYKIRRLAPRRTLLTIEVECR